MMNVEQARFNMIEQQIRPWDVLDQNVLDLLYKVRREEFVPAVYRGLAFSDLEIPIGAGERMMAPKMEARVLQEVAPKRTDRILEIGTGSGYMTALLAAMGAHVYSVEIDAGLKASGEATAAFMADFLCGRSAASILVHVPVRLQIDVDNGAKV